MKKKNPGVRIKKIVLHAIVIFLFISLIQSCTKNNGTTPYIQFKTGHGYISKDATVAIDSVLAIGINAQKRGAELNTYDVSVAFDGNSMPHLLQDYQLVSAQRLNYDKDVNVRVRDHVGTEKYFFTITDADGNAAQLSLTITVK